EQHALVSSQPSSTSPSNASRITFDQDFDFLSHLDFDYTDPAFATAAVLDLSVFPTPELDNLDFDCPPLDPFAAATTVTVPPLFDDFFPSPLPVPILSSAATSLSNTPATALPHSPCPTPPSPEYGGAAFFPGLKLPQQQQSQRSKSGRRPAGASLSHTADWRITKKRAAASSPEDEDPEVLSRRYRNNLAAKRYRQKKVDRIEELENEVKEVQKERDDLRIQLARQEAEVAALREMLKMKMGGGGSKD
ncbi:hypothetical protein C8A05DRAFT_14951, partial [Staphylotrichum tortipilum]